MIDQLTTAAVATARKAGWVGIAEPNADPSTTMHIVPGDPGPEDEIIASCGHDLRTESGGAFAPICRTCARVHADEQWVQDCRGSDAL